MGTYRIWWGLQSGFGISFRATGLRASGSRTTDLLDAAQKLLQGGEDLRDVLEAFAELLVHP
jgi:hypothetical protein